MLSPICIRSAPAAMGLDGTDSVVDPRLRVCGIGRPARGRCRDHPTVPAGNTNAPTIMVAEKSRRDDP